MLFNSFAYDFFLTKLIAYMIQSSFFQIINTIPWKDLRTGTQRQIYGYDDKIMLAKINQDCSYIQSINRCG